MSKLLQVVFVLLAVGIIAALYFTRDVLEERPLIGGGRDQYGCLGAAGFSFDVRVGACVRLWELEGSEAARIAAEALKPDFGLTIISVAPLDCLGCFTVEADKLGERHTVLIRNLKVEEVIGRE
jgi:hypothetical protein